MHTPKIIALMIVLMTPVFAEVSRVDDPDLAEKGPYKWTVGATGNAGEVVVMRWSRTWTVRETKHVSIHDTVLYNPGKKTEGAFVATLNEAKRQWLIEPFGDTGWLDGVYSNSSFGDNSGTIKFTNKKGESYEYQFSAFVISYQKAARIYDGLPSDSTTGWTWAGEPKNEGEQAVPPNGP